MIDAYGSQSASPTEPRQPTEEQRKARKEEQERKENLLLDTLEARLNAKEVFRFDVGKGDSKEKLYTVRYFDNDQAMIVGDEFVDAYTGWDFPQHYKIPARTLTALNFRTGVGFHMIPHLRSEGETTSELIILDNLKESQSMPVYLLDALTKLKEGYSIDVVKLKEGYPEVEDFVARFRSAFVSTTLLGKETFPLLEWRTAPNATKTDWEWDKNYKKIARRMKEIGLVERTGPSPLFNDYIGVIRALPYNHFSSKLELYIFNYKELRDAYSTNGFTTKEMQEIPRKDNRIFEIRSKKGESTKLLVYQFKEGLGQHFERRLYPDVAGNVVFSVDTKFVHTLERIAPLPLNILAKRIVKPLTNERPQRAGGPVGGVVPDF